MKAAFFDGVGQPLRIGAAPDPSPAADEVVLHIAACGICGSDLHITTDPATFGIGAGAVLGHEFAGEVVALGFGVTDLRIGDQVAVCPIFGCGHCPRCLAGDPAWCAQMRLIGGGYAEYAAVAARQCRVLPQGVSLAEGALAEPVAVGLHCVQRAGVRPGETVLIMGTGPIGLLVAFWARRMGAGRVVVADLADHQRARALALGATGFVVSGPDMAAEVNDLCNGPPDIVFECVGKRGLIDACIGQVRPQGRVIGVGLCTGGDSYDAFRAISKEVTVIMSVFFNMHEFGAALDALTGGAFAPQRIITDRIGLAALPTTFEGLRQRTTQCKVLVTPRVSDGV
jgi:threonine dehydrogenase-like Zn-dependent dehydrogenase